MPTTLLELRETTRDEALDRIDAIHQDAADAEGRDLTDAEEAELTELRSSVETLDTQIASMTADLERRERAQVQRTSRPALRRPTNSRGDAGDVQVRAEPTTYGTPEGELHPLFVRDLALMQGVISGDRGEAQARMARHQEEVENYYKHADPMERDIADRQRRDDNGILNPWPALTQSRGLAVGTEQRTTAVTSNFAPIVPQTYRPDMISYGIHPSAVSTRTMRRVPLTSVGLKDIWPRVTTKATAGIHKEDAAYSETAVALSSIEVDIFEVAAQLPVSNRLLERGLMPTPILTGELFKAHMETLNAKVLFGDGNTSASEEPAGVFYQGTGKTVTFVNWDQSDKTKRTVTAFAHRLNGVIDTLWAALLEAPDAIIMGPTLWGKLRAWADSTGRPMFGLDVGTARNQAGVADRVPMSEMSAMPVGDFFGIPIYVDGWISNTFKADDSATTGGTETRVIVMQRYSVPVAYDGPATYTFEQTLATKGNVLLVCRGWAAFNAGWRPEGIRVLGGSGTAVDGGNGTAGDVGLPDDEVDADDETPADDDS